MSVWELLGEVVAWRHLLFGFSVVFLLIASLFCLVSGLFVGGGGVLQGLLRRRAWALGVVVVGSSALVVSIVSGRWDPPLPMQVRAPLFLVVLASAWLVGVVQVIRWTVRGVRARRWRPIAVAVALALSLPGFLGKDLYFDEAWVNRDAGKEGPGWRVSMEPTYLLVHPGQRPEPIVLEVLDHEGRPVDPERYYPILVSTDAEIARLSGSGEIDVRAVPPDFAAGREPTQVPQGEGGWARVRGGVYEVPSTTRPLLRRTPRDRGLELRTYRSEHVAVRIPVMVEGFDLDEVMRAHHVMEALEVAWLAQRRAVGTEPDGGAPQHVVLDVYGAGEADYCGLAGNPIIIPWRLGRAAGRQCFFDAHGPRPWAPRWRTLLHELGHNFTLASLSFQEFADADPDHRMEWVQGYANLAAYWSEYLIGVAGVTLPDRVKESVAASFERSRERSRRDRARRRQERLRGAGVEGGEGGERGKVRLAFEQADLEAVFFEVHEQHGPRVWFDLFSTFLPADRPLPCRVEGAVGQATWFAASLSVATGKDLREPLRERHGLPIDDAVWEELTGCVERRIRASWRRNLPIGPIDPAAGETLVEPGPGVRPAGIKSLLES